MVQEAYKLDFINDMADSIGKSIQTLAGVTQNGFSSTGFYVGFLLLIILVVGMYVAYTGLIKRETSKALHAVINFVVVFVLSASFIAYAPDYIKKINTSSLFSRCVSGSLPHCRFLQPQFILLVKACRHAPFKSFLVIVLHGISTQRNSPVDNNRLVAIISFI